MRPPLARLVSLLSFVANHLPKLLSLLDKSKDSSLPVIVVEGNSRKLVGMVSAWDVLEGAVMGRLVDRKGSGKKSAKNK